MTQLREVYTEMNRKQDKPSVSLNERLILITVQILGICVALTFSDGLAKTVGLILFGFAFLLNTGGMLVEYSDAKKSLSKRQEN